MKNFMICLIATALHFGSTCAMCCNIPFTESQQKLYDKLALKYGISKLQNFESQLMAETLNDSDFLKVLEKSVDYAEQVSTFIDNVRVRISEKSEEVDVIIVRAALCRESGSLLADYADLLRRNAILTKIEESASDSLKIRMQRIGLIH